MLRKSFPYEWSIELLESRIYIIASRVKAETDMCILNAYAPCGLRETKVFLQRVKTIVNEINAEIKIVCGDSNAVLCNDKDIINGEKTSRVIS